MDEGHCGLPTEELIPLAEKLLEVPKELIRTALDLELQEGTVVAERPGSEEPSRLSHFREGCLILSEAQAPQLDHNVHDGAFYARDVCP
jgi:hypothetical protein